MRVLGARKRKIIESGSGDKRPAIAIDSVFQNSTVKTLRLPVNYKFAVVAIETDPSYADVLFPLRFDGHLWASSTPPFRLDRIWRDWLGLQADHFRNSNLYLTATALSQLPNVLGEEDRELERTARFLFIALSIEGLHVSRTGLIVQGTSLPDPIGTQIRSVHDTARVFRLEGAPKIALSAATLVRAAQVAMRMLELFQAKPVPRLWKGVMSLFTALQARAGTERLHGFVRSLDAVTKPPQGEGRKKFVHRCSVFAGRREKDRKLLNELYLLRSAAEHLNDFQSVLHEYATYERESIALQRAEQAELLARGVYVRILSSSELTVLFSDDRWLEQFWNMQDHETASFWGAPLDLTQIPRPALRLSSL